VEQTFMADALQINFAVWGMLICGGIEAAALGDLIILK
jgi:hypothetical protein